MRLRRGRAASPSCRPDIPAAMDRVEVELGDRPRARLRDLPGRAHCALRAALRLRAVLAPSAGLEEGVVGARARGEHLGERGLASAPGGQRGGGGCAVVAVDRLASSCAAGSTQTAAINASASTAARRDDARCDRVHHAARDARLRGAPGEAAVALTRDRGLVHEQGEGLRRKSRTHHGNEGRVAGRGRGQRRRPGRPDRAAARARARCSRAPPPRRPDEASRRSAMSRAPVAHGQPAVADALQQRSELSVPGLVS